MFHVSSTLILIAISYDSLSFKFIVCDTVCVCVADFCKFASLDVCRINLKRVMRLPRRSIRILFSRKHVGYMQDCHMN